MHLYGTQAIGGNGHLTIGGVDSVQLAKEYGTPLYVYDIELFRKRARAFQETFESAGIGYQVAYASKAFSSIAIYQVAAQEGLSLDVVSGGELYTAVKAGFPKEKIHFHGNNKSLDELEKITGNYFFRANRQFLVSRSIITSAHNFFSRKLALNLSIPFSPQIIVSKEKKTTFLDWLSQVTK